MTMENKTKHLEMIQAIINRMAQCSFSLKGWAVTLVVALLALSTAATEKIAVIIICFIPLGVFWILDAYYLWQERMFRALYDRVRVLGEADIDFSMNTSPFRGGRNTWRSVVLSSTIATFYVSLLVVMIAVIVLIRCFGGQLT
jgi:hypothetical protein